MHSITFTNIKNTSYIAIIDGTPVEFSRAMNKTKYGDCDALSEYVDSIEQFLAQGLPLAPLSSRMNGVNMLRLLNGHFREQTIREWLHFISSDITIPTRTAFINYFGFEHNKTVFPCEFGQKLYDMSVQEHKIIKEKKKNDEAALKRYSERARALYKIVSQIENEVSLTREWVVKKQHISNNITSYQINGQEISFCLSGHADLCSAKIIADYLLSLEKAFSVGNSNQIRGIIKKFGSKAAFQILDCFFHDEATHFFQSEFVSDVLYERKKPTPCSFLKSFFGGRCDSEDTHYLELINILEAQIPALEDILITSSPYEMSKRSSKWVLFYHKQTSLRKCTINFPNRHPLQEEMTQLNLYLYNNYSSSAGDVFQRIQEHNCAFLKLLKIKGTQSISSALDLTSWDIRDYTASTTAIDGLALTTVRRDLFCIRSFLYYLDPQVAEKILPLSIIPSQMPNVTRPIDASVIEKIAEHRSELPEYIWLAFQVFAETGARAGSVFALTTENLIALDGHCVVRMYYKKASGKKAESGTPSYVIHSISDGLAESLQAYIRNTEIQRALLKRNYIFVYQCETFRTNSKRMPSVLTSSTFSHHLQKLCREHCIYDREGQLPAWSARSIRAEVGRSLFSRGASPETVAAKLGNTPAVAKMHYDSMYPADEANLRRALYEQTLEATVTQTRCPSVSKLTPMYGSCEADRECHNKNDCRNCSPRIEKRP